MTARLVYTEARWVLQRHREDPWESCLSVDVIEVNCFNYHQSCNPRNNVIKKTNAIECPFDNIIITILLYIKYKHRIDFNLNLPRQVREPRQSGLLPSVLDGRFADVPLRHQCPFRDVDTLGSKGWLVGVLCEHPIAVLLTDLRLEWLVIADVDRLNHAGASGGMKSTSSPRA